MRQIGIMGGTFNPIHNGHLHIAHAACEQYHLDEVWFMPNHLPAYKSAETLVAAEDRVHMIQLAIEHQENFILSDLELRRPGYTYTYQTLEQLKQRYPNVCFYFILGADSLFSFENWKYPELVARSCILLVAGRGGEKNEALSQTCRALSETYHADIRLIHCDNLEISSDFIRKNLKNNKSVLSFLPKKVYDYIQKKHLYQM